VPVVWISMYLVPGGTEKFIVVIPELLTDPLYRPTNVPSQLSLVYIDIVPVPPTYKSMVTPGLDTVAIWTIAHAAVGWNVA